MATQRDPRIDSAYPQCCLLGTATIHTESAASVANIVPSFVALKPLERGYLARLHVLSYLFLSSPQVMESLPFEDNVYSGGAAKGSGTGTAASASTNPCPK